MASYSSTVSLPSLNIDVIRRIPSRTAHCGVPLSSRGRSKYCSVIRASAESIPGAGPLAFAAGFATAFDDPERRVPFDLAADLVLRGSQLSGREVRLA